MMRVRKRPNILIIMSDEHDPAVSGCYGHPKVKTPNLDRLAAEGVLFENAYCNSPMCVPSRMSFLTGKYCHQIQAWDNGSPLRSEIPTFAHYFEAGGYDTLLCGRMHIVGPDRLHGFGKRLYDDLEHQKLFEQKPKRTPEERRKSNSHVTECGPGKGSWQPYDEMVTELTVRFLKSQAEYPAVKPWLMVAGLMFPHFPLIAPKEYFDMYYPDNVVLPDLKGETPDGQHPVIRHLRYCFRNDAEVPEEILRKALASYYGLVTVTDANIGRMLQVIDQSALKDNTVVIYLSDHGEMAGQHGIWQKQCFYEASVKVPMIMRIPEGEPGRFVRSDVSLADIMPTILQMAGMEAVEGLAGESLMHAMAGDERERVVFSEYHAQGMLNAGYMIKKGDFKYNYYVGHRPELYNIKEDPGEFKDLAKEAGYRQVLKELHGELLHVLQPEETDGKAKRNQALEGIKRAFQ